MGGGASVGMAGSPREAAGRRDAINTLLAATGGEVLKLSASKEKGAF